MQRSSSNINGTGATKAVSPQIGQIKIGSENTTLPEPSTAKPADTIASSINILMVEDDPFYYRYIRALLEHFEQPAFTLSNAASMSQATNLLSWKTPDVILLDMNLPDSCGIDTVVATKRLANTVPVIVLTGSDDKTAGLKAVAEGADDYLVKQRITAESLTWCIRYAIERYKSEQSRLRLTAIKDFTAALAHDLKTPLIGASYVLQALLSGDLGSVPRKQFEALDQLRQSNDSQLTMVQRLLNIYQYESPDSITFQPLPIAELLTHCISRLESMLPSVTKIELCSEQNLPPINGDRNALQLLFSSLLENAIKFGTPGGMIRITVIRTNESVVIEVHNDGDPIPNDGVKQLFQNFWQGVPGRQYTPNTGLGLYVSNRIAILHGGNIRCSSSHQTGTTFTVALPAASNH